MPNKARSSSADLSVRTRQGSSYIRRGYRALDVSGQLKRAGRCYVQAVSSRWEEKVGIWRLRARLGFYLKKIEQGREIIVTRRGSRVARISRLGGDHLEHLVRRGLVRMPVGRRLPRRARVEAAGSISGLVAEQRR
jgi:antitoxin (DNA-binding transcriptional repressor) of toxin-antitoxin stability system